MKMVEDFMNVKNGEENKTLQNEFRTCQCPSNLGCRKSGW